MLVVADFSLHSTGNTHSPASQVIRVPLEADPTIHGRYRPGQPGYDLCFLRLRSRLPLGGSVLPLCLPEKDFSENILMQDGEEGVISPGSVRHSYVSLEDCRDHLNLSFTLNNKMFCMKAHKPETDTQEEGKSPSTLQSSLITREKGMRPRTQQTVWMTDDDLFEYSEDIGPLSEDVASTVPPSAQNKMYLTAEVIRNPTQEGTSRPPAESRPKKVEKLKDTGPLSEDVKSTVPPTEQNKTLLTSEVMRNTTQDKASNLPAESRPKKVENPKGIVPLSKDVVKSTVPPSKQNKTLLTAEVMRNTTQEKASNLPAGSRPKKVENPKVPLKVPLSKDVVKSTVPASKQNKTLLTAEVMRDTKQEKTAKPTAGSPTNVGNSAPTVSRRGDCRFLSGTPVASVKGQTVFVTGLMLSHDCSQGLVFTKLSRFLPWIESMLESS
ncbi:mucin-2-like [Sardina pilchardus]|uniref:mucin-2-like n=1 Tax=Sardina pilchardus TaxID=27697 RepID=UPI002E14A5D8